MDGFRFQTKSLRQDINGSKIYAHYFLALLWLVGFAVHDTARSQKLTDYGIVLMHGKGGGPGGPIASISGALQSAGAAVITPEMPWSRRRMYDATYEQAMVQIHAVVQTLRAQGKTKIVIAGHSFGANAAIGYAGRYDGVAAVVALAPGHVPESSAFLTHTAKSVERAKKLVTERKGEERQPFSDFNQGKSFDVQASPKVYLSFFDPSGPASMKGNAGKMKAVPILLAISRGDPWFTRVRAYLYIPAAKNPKSKYIELGGGHNDTPELAKSEVIAWLSML